MQKRLHERATPHSSDASSVPAVATSLNPTSGSCTSVLPLVAPRLMINISCHIPSLRAVPHKSTFSPLDDAALLARGVADPPSLASATPPARPTRTASPCLLPAPAAARPGHCRARAL
ncbi:hypothetical protein M758_2G225500 [Ceratodon purpureus]|nr:hypothetical protein M758_2G225500 [Ceratodon purpureus]